MAQVHEPTTAVGDGQPPPPPPLAPDTQLQAAGPGPGPDPTTTTSTTTNSQGSDHGDNTKEQEPPAVKKNLRFWLVVAALAVTSLLVALEVTIVSTGTATIVAELGGQNSYSWMAGSYLLALTALQPFYAQLGNLFGRRWPFVASICLFMLGSGICGGASSMAMVIAGRTVQGIGGAGVNVLSELIVCDLVPLRERGSILGIVFGASALGPAVGPVIGGVIVEQSTWRWIFYINLPIGGLALVMTLLFLRLRNDNKADIATSLARIDWTGNVIFVGACSSTLIATTWGGSVYAWSSYQVLVPLVLGLLGLAGFVVFERFPRLAPNPITPLHLFSNRTTVVVFVNTFLQGIVIIAVLYFLPVYFQAVLLSDPERSGVQLLPMALLQIVFAIVGGASLQKFGTYHVLHGISFGGTVLGVGLVSTLTASSSTALWAVYEVILASFLGLGIPVMLPVAQARLADADAATSTALWGFLRTFGMVWGSVIPAAAFNNRFVALAAARIDDAAVRATFAAQGQALQHGAAREIAALPEPARSQVRAVFAGSLRRAWLVVLAFPALAFLLVFLMEKVELRTELDTAYGVDHGGQAGQDRKDEEKQQVRGA